MRVIHLHYYTAAAGSAALLTAYLVRGFEHHEVVAGGGQRPLACGQRRRQGAGGQRHETQRGVLWGKQARFLSCIVQQTAVALRRQAAPLRLPSPRPPPRAPSYVTSTSVMGRPMPGMEVLAWVSVFSLYSRTCGRARQEEGSTEAGGATTAGIVPVRLRCSREQGCLSNAAAELGPTHVPHPRPALGFHPSPAPPAVLADAPCRRRRPPPRTRRRWWPCSCSQGGKRQKQGTSGWGGRKRTQCEETVRLSGNVCRAGLRCGPAGRLLPSTCSVCCPHPAHGQGATPARAAASVPPSPAHTRYSPCT